MIDKSTSIVVDLFVQGVMLAVKVFLIWRNKIK